MEALFGTDSQYHHIEGPLNDGTCFVETTLFVSSSRLVKLVVHDYGDGYDDWLVFEGHLANDTTAGNATWFLADCEETQSRGTTRGNKTNWKQRIDLERSSDGSVTVVFVVHGKSVRRRLAM